MIALLPWIVAGIAGVQEPPVGETPAPLPPEKAKIVELALLAKPLPSGIALRFPALPDDQFELITCEAVLVGGVDLGVHQIAPKPEEWIRTASSWSYSAKLPRGLELGFTAVAGETSVALEYRLTNRGEEALDLVQLHPCLPTIGAPSFFPGTAEQAQRGGGARGARAQTKDWSELWSRLFVWRHGKPRAFASSAFAKSEVHLAFVAEGEPVTEWSWWRNAPELFDRPWMALVAKDGKHTLTLSFERSNWASSNVGDARSCLHLFPWFGALARGETKTVRGEIALVEGGLEVAEKRLASTTKDAKPVK